MDKVDTATELFTLFVIIRQDQVFLEKCPIQLIFLMIVDVGKILFQLKSTIIASIEYVAMPAKSWRSKIAAVMSQCS